nr:D-2-hydroxyacid dehydrogenase [Altericroceibacterium spongiae]
MPVAILSADLRDQLEARLPEGIEPLWFDTPEEMVELAPEAEIGWFDQRHKPPMIEAIRQAQHMRWLHTGIAGLDFIPPDLLEREGLIVTNGAGINSSAVAEYALMGMLTIAKDYPAIVRAQDRHEWLSEPPGTRQLAGSRALILGYGTIGRLIGQQLTAFGVECVPVRHSAKDGALGPDEWRGRLDEFDWIVLAVPSTDETTGMIGAKELAAMKSEAVLVNIARGDVVDQDALVDVLRDRRIHAAFCEVTTPEPLPADHPLWSLDNAHISMHLSGLSNTKGRQVAAERFLENCRHFLAGEDHKMISRYDPKRGY